MNSAPPLPLMGSLTPGPHCETCGARATVTYFDGATVRRYCAIHDPQIPLPLEAPMTDPATL